MKKTQINWTNGSLAYEDNLSQASQLKKEDLHSQISIPNKYLKIKPSGRTPPNETDDVPPGFERSCSSSSSSPSLNKKRIPIVSIDPGYTPPQFSMNPKWLVAAGEESQERLSQRNRESKVQEAIYRHQSSIPANPCVSMEVQREHYDDSLTPTIPIEEIETDHSSSSPSSMPPPPPPQTISSSAKFPQTDAVVSALLKSGEFGSVIDTDLLLQILSDPKMVCALLNNLVDVEPPKHGEDYYKNLIRQHGGEMIGQMTNRSLNNHNIPKKEQNPTLKDKTKKQCRFFNSKNGCRYGVSCLFLHEAKTSRRNSTVLAVVEEQSAKRLRVS